MAYEYNPLLKQNLQKKADTASVEAEIDELRKSKVTKFFSASDTLQNGEIAQYQGNDDSVNGLQKGFFYLYNSVSIPANTPYYRILNDFTIDSITIKAGDYYKINSLSPLVGKCLCQKPQNGDFFFYGNQSATNFVDWIGFDFSNKKFVKIVSQSNFIVTLDDGRTADFNSGGYSTSDVILTSSANGELLTMSPEVKNSSNKLFILTSDNGVDVPIVLAAYTEWQLLSTSESVNITSFTQVNAQPRQTQVIIRQWTTE